MAKPVNIKVTGIKRAKKLLISEDALIKGVLIPAGLRKAALLLQREVKLSIAGRRAEPTSVDTGRLLNSVDIKITAKDAEIFSEIPYAKFIEFGTTRVKARKHFNNSKDRNAQKIVNVLKSELRTI